MSDSPWPAGDARLRMLWDTGLSTARIGEAMGLSKNAIVGRAHRLGLVSRASPIRRDGVDRPPTPRRVRPGTATLPALASPAPDMPAVEFIGVDLGVGPDVSVMVHFRAAPVVSPKALSPVARSHSCCWPLGEPKTPSFRYCEDAAPLGKPYCDKHAEIAYVRVARVRYA